MNSKKVTRGFGVLENFLSIQRRKKAENLIKAYNKQGRILDIGCGVYPFFLSHCNFEEKYGVDKEIKDLSIKSLNLNLIKYDLSNEKLPFQENYFDAITMLAVIEHLTLFQVNLILKNCYLMLKNNGILIITTPAKWSDILLKTMSKIHLVSPEEINEHKHSFSLPDIKNLLIKANFRRENIQGDFFELFLNLWICAVKKN